MSALLLRRVSKENASSGCIEEGCNLKARYEIAIAGYRLLTSSRFLSCRLPEALCAKHAKQWKASWRELSGEQAHEEAEAAIRLLISAAGEESGAAQVIRADAIDILATIGFKPEAIAAARTRALDGWPVEEIVERLSPQLAEAVA
jgi:hypothetical protein